MRQTRFLEVKNVQALRPQLALIQFCVYATLQPFV